MLRVPEATAGPLQLPGYPGLCWHPRLQGAPQNRDGSPHYLYREKSVIKHNLIFNIWSPHFYTAVGTVRRAKKFGRIPVITKLMPLPYIRKGWKSGWKWRKLFFAESRKISICCGFLWWKKYYVQVPGTGDYFISSWRAGYLARIIVMVFKAVFWIWIRILKVWIRPLINLWDLKDALDQVLEFRGAWPKRTVLRVLDIKYKMLFFFYSSFRTFFSRVRIFGWSGSGLRKKSYPDPGKKPDPKHWFKGKKNQANNDVTSIL